MGTGDKKEEPLLLEAQRSFSPIVQKFDDYVRPFQDKEVKAVITQQFTPDPDSMASALGLQYLLESEYGIVAEIIAKGAVSHPQNLTMKNVLDIQLKENPKSSFEDYDLVFCVDTVPQNTGFLKEISKFDVVLDHHQFDLDLPVTDIRTCGSCSAIVWDYLDQFDVEWDTDRGIQVATALLFGILNDTGDLLSENTNSLDLRAHADLITKVSRKSLSDIIKYSFPSYLYELRCLAVDNKIVKDSMLISSLGILTRKKRDALPLIADEFLRMEGIETVVVHAIVEDCMEASVRSRNASINVHDFCQRIFGEDHAGGKHGAGGAKTPLGFLYSSEDSEDLRQEFCKVASQVLTNRILAFTSGG